MKQKDIQHLEAKIDSAMYHLERSFDVKLDAKSSSDRLWMLGGAIGLLVSNGIIMKLIGD